MCIDVFPTVADNYNYYSSHPNEILKIDSKATYDICPHKQVFFNSGVIVWRKSKLTQMLFSAWHEEWKIYKAMDQMSLARICYKNNIRIKVLPAKYNFCKNVSIDEAKRNKISIMHFLGEGKETLKNLMK